MRDRPLAMSQRRRAKNKGFTLVEILVVLIIASILIGLTAPQVISMVGSTNFSRAITTMSGVLENARQYATSRNTYVYVAFWEDTTYRPSEGNLFYIAIATTDGSKGADPANPDWNTQVDLDPYGEVIPGTMNLQYQIIQSLGSIPNVELTDGYDPRIQNKTSLRTLTNSEVYSWTNYPSFKIKIPYAGQEETFEKVITFTPSGEVRVDENPLLAVELALVRRKQKNPDVALFRIGGVTGGVQVGRK